MKRYSNEIMLIVAVAVIVFVLSMHLFGRSGRTSGPHVSCPGHLKNISHALFMYAEENDGWYPPELNTLLEEGYLDDPYTLQCPKAASRIEMEVEDWSKFPSDYVYRGATPPDQVTSTTPIVADCPCNHKHGGLVVMGDGDVDWIDNPEFLDVYNKIIQASGGLKGNQESSP